MVDENGAICVSVSFKTSIDERDTVFATLTSPDGKLTWEAECALAKNAGNVYRTLGDIYLPYIDGGEWKLKVSRSDKSANGTFILSKSTVENAFEYPEFLRNTKVTRVNGNVYTIESPDISYRDTVEISAISRVAKRAEYVSFLKGERYKNVAISTDAIAIVFTYTNDEGTIFRKVNVI